MRSAPFLLLATALTAGCAGYQSFREGRSAIAEGRTEEGLAKLRDALNKSPNDKDYRRTFYVERDAAVNAALREADAAMEQGSFDAARAAYARASRQDPSNARATSGRERADAAERQWLVLDAAIAQAKAGALDSAISKAQQVLSESAGHRRASLLLRQLIRQQADASGKELGIHPKLKATYRVPVSLSFTNASLIQVFEALKQASGLNYMIERDVRAELRVTLSVTNKPVEDIVRLLLATNQLESRVLDDDTLLIYPNVPAKASEYREMVVRSFFLSNADATKVATVLKTIARVRDVVVDEKLNMVMVRDSVEAVRLAERVIATQDIPDPEVMLELEVLEVSASRLIDLGIRWPDSISAGVVGVDEVPGQLRLDELRSKSSSFIRVATGSPAISAQIRSQVSDANLLANPRVRVRNRQSAKILIGERVPVITTTATANVGASESVNYLDVGLKLEIEPTISLDDEVSMKIALEVSNILETISRPGTQAYRLGTRNTSTTLRVRDGETNILAGLIQRDERRSNIGIPGLNEVPIFGKLFGGAEDSAQKTEIVLLITPRIVRNLDVPGVGQLEFNSGTEAAVGARPIQLGTLEQRTTSPASLRRAEVKAPESSPRNQTSVPPSLVVPPLVPTSPSPR